MKRKAYAFAWLLSLSGTSVAATLYEWTDPSGETRYGYRPPPGVVGAVVGERARQPVDPGKPVNCRALQEEHLRLIDKEIARLRGLPTGVGPQFEFTAEARQRFVNDLLAHRAALLTGRSPEEFSAPDNPRQRGEIKEQYQKEKARLLENLETQARQLEQERREVERQRRENEITIQRYRTLYPGLPLF